MSSKDKLLEILKDPSIDRKIKSDLLGKIASRRPSSLASFLGVDEEAYQKPAPRKPVDLSEGRAMGDPMTGDKASLAGGTSSLSSTQEPSVSEKTISTETLPGEVSGLIGGPPDFTKLDKMQKEQGDYLKKQMVKYDEATKAHQGIERDVLEKSSEAQKQGYEESVAYAQKQAELKSKLMDRYLLMDKEWQTSQLRPLRAISQSSTGSLISMAIAQGLAIGSGDTQSYDRLQKMVDGAIERDIASQKYEIDKKGQAANNALSMIRSFVPDDPEVLKNQARELYNKFLVLQLEMLKKSTANPEHILKMTEMQMKVNSANKELEELRAKSTQSWMEMKLKAQKDFGREVKTEIETGNGNAKSPKVTQGIVESISGSLNTINDIGEFIKTYGSAFPGTLNIAGASQGLASTESSRLMEKIILDYGYSKSGKALTKTEAEAVRRVIKGGHLTGKSSTYGGVKIILSDVIGRLEGYKKQGLLKPEDEKALANARGLLGELEAKSK